MDSTCLLCTSGCGGVGCVNLDVPFYYVWGCLVVGCQALELNEPWHSTRPDLSCLLLTLEFGLVMPFVYFWSLP